MTSDNTNFWQWIVIGILVIAVAVLGFMVFNLNSHVGIVNAHIEAINKNGRELTAWAAESAKWATHVNTEHFKTDHGMGGTQHPQPSHISPPPDPPDPW